ncbi:MAG: hypothetical protein A3D65_00455 [Candidatus Lloydbacteria bacterium RIFCSPHIGHO2_02_FULL_50_13]|uniref:Uncharacterized protein n=1 Tax=Candidatus Lloydbacteria bacterium RIFCSPHIGHO2_02_FULL_50_13 TaxID=1798661 RepID=A0A1G2DAR1_9BACT|nr:MAG: hypothetical protein A3D65_00455 [Candidatus Lloydbacteria bacterium RIFCSPHIGHO2_02_FULL_50_13]
MGDGNTNHRPISFYHYTLLCIASYPQFFYFVIHSIVADNQKYLEKILPPITDFLGRRLQLSLHPNKVFIRPHIQGIDFLGYVTLPHHIMLRTKTSERMWRKLKERVSQYRTGDITESTLSASLQSYLGVLSHANAYRLSEELKNQFWFWLKE